MKLISLFLLFLAAMPLAAAEPVFKAADPAIRYVGRTKTLTDGSVKFDWSGTYLETNFTGGSVALRLSERGVSYYNVFVDGKPQGVMKSCGVDTLITVVEGLSRKLHSLRLQKRSEGEFGCTTLHSLVLARGGRLQAGPQKRKRFIEFYGNSLTCGYGTDGKDKTEPFKVETENCNLSFSNIIPRYFDADYALIAHSGRGVVRNYGDSVRCSAVTMKERMLRTFDEDPDELWDFKKGYQPDLVIINLGTNDFSTEPHPYRKEFVPAYVQILRQLREAYGKELPVLCVYSCTMRAPVFSYYEEAVRQMDDDRIYLLQLRSDLLNDSTDLGGGYHPSYQGHKKMAMCMIPYISTITGWSMK